ncbi:MAG: hypothetical protein ACK5LN_09310 [Propioniciclava sp.]
MTTLYFEAGLEDNLRKVGFSKECRVDPQIVVGLLIIASHHDLWHVEQSFRMSESDLAARPIYHYLKDSIEAHPHHLRHRPRDRPRPASP